MNPARIAVIALVVLAGTVPAGAGAAPAVHNPKGKFLGVVRHHAAAASQPAPVNNLAYHNGPVMHSNRTHVVYWEPAGHTTTATYKALIQRYLGDVAADSGELSNVYASDVQYTDNTGGKADYISTFADAWTDTTAYSSKHSTPCTTASPCVTDGEIQAELDSFLTAHSLPRGLGDMYVVALPAGVGSCFTDSTGTSCSDTTYCAYHSSFGSGASTTIYSVQPFGDVPGCQSGQHPNGDSADDTINLISHEHNEAITDPLGTGWYDKNGLENGDKCAWTFGSSTPSNQSINSNPYYLQREWSNAQKGCVLFMNAAPSAAFGFSPGSPQTGETVSFDGTPSSDSDGSIASYSWSFGDGGTDSGAKPLHPYTAPGTYTVTLTVTDDTGNTGSVQHEVTVGAGPSNGAPIGTTSTAGTPTGSTSTPVPLATPTLAPVVHLALLGQVARVTTGRLVRVHLVCRAGAACRGTLRIQARMRDSRRVLHTVLLGTARFAVAPGHAATVRVRLSRLAARLLRAHPRLRVTVRAFPAGAAPIARAITLTRPAG